MIINSEQRSSLWGNVDDDWFTWFTKDKIITIIMDRIMAIEKVQKEICQRLTDLEKGMLR